MRLLLPLILLVAACSTPDAGEAAALSTAEPIAVSMSLYVVDSSGGGPGSSQRTVAEIEDSFDAARPRSDLTDVLTP